MTFEISGNIPEVSEEPLTGLPKASTVSPLSPFFSASSTLVFYPKVPLPKGYYPKLPLLNQYWILKAMGS